MKKPIIFLCFFILAVTLKAQVKLDVVNSMGGSVQYAGGYLAYSIGEPIIGTATGSSATITQGFLQTWQAASKRFVLKLYLAGLYDLNTHNMHEAIDGNTSTPKWGNGIADKIDVELRNETAPYDLVMAFSNQAVSNSGVTSITVPAGHNGNYYIKVLNRNHLETWSAIPVNFAVTNVQYDFSTSMLQAYGTDAQMQMESGKYAFLLGDLNQSGYVDLDDFIMFEPDLTSGSMGFLSTDFNGGGYVDLDDYVMFEPMLTLGPVVQSPL